MREYAVIFEWANSNYSAYVPDLPGCISTGKTLDEARANIREAIRGHLAAMLEYNEAVPEPTTIAESIRLTA